jgi:FdhE protein
VQAQAALAGQIDTPPWDAEAIAQAQQHAMPLSSAADSLPADWQRALHRLLDELNNGDTLPLPLQDVLARLRTQPADELDALARRVLAGAPDAPDLAAAPIVMAALQLVFVHRASQLRERDVPYTQPMSVCPVCASPPVASVLRIGGADGGLRFLHCGTCCTEWHMVRVKCCHCESTGGVHYQGAVAGDGDGQDVSREVVLAETCDACHTYTKLINQEKDPLAEPLADDLASLTLDLLMGETEFARANGNPLLYLGTD